MRKKSKKQMPLMEPAVDHPRAAELEAINRILDDNPIISELVLQDLCKGKRRRRRSGAKGMTAEQVLRAGIVKQIFGFTYEELAFHIVDSKSLRRFMLIGIADKGFKKSVLCKTVKAISPETWEAINKVLAHYAQDEKIEKGREVRIDCTVVESNILKPRDSNLLYDSVRVLSRLLSQAKEDYGLPIIFTNHTRRAKRRSLGILNAKGEKDRKKHYLDLLKVTAKTMGYVDRAIETINNTVSAGMGLIPQV